MTPVVAVVGYSNSGKTRVAASLVKSLSEQGYRVAAVKHCHAGHEMDGHNSDTSRLFGAGAAVVIASSPGQRTRIERTNGDTSLERLAASFGEEADLIVAEGFKSCSAPKVLVVGSDAPPPEVDNVIAVVGNTGPLFEAPLFDFSELPALADRVREQLLNTIPVEARVSLSVDGVDIPLKRYPSSVLMNLLEGFVASLDGIPAENHEVQVTLKSRPGRNPGQPR